MAKSPSANPSLQLPSTAIATLKGHSNGVNHAVVYDAGRRALSASDDFTLKVWDLDSRELLHSLEGHDDEVLHSIVFANGRRALSTSIDHTLKVWDLESARLIHTLEGHSHNVLHAVVFADGKRALSASTDHTLKIWDLESGRIIRSLLGHSHSVLHTVVFADGKRALSASADHTLKIWDLESGRILNSLKGHSSYVLHAVVYADGRRVLSASQDNTLKVWDLESGRLIHTLVGHSHNVRHAVVYADSHRALSVSTDDTLKVWNLDSGRLIHSLEGHHNTVVHGVVYANGHRALSVSIDTTLKVWDLNVGRILHSLEGHDDFVRHAVVFANGRRALSASADNTLKLWDLESLDGLAASEKSSLYINAKVALIGDSGVGKSGLRTVLEGKSFAATDSTHGRYVAAFDKTFCSYGSDNTLHREILLWDLAGQPNYRLINQLHLRDVAVALVVFDSRSETDPFAGVRHWNRALEVARKAQPSSGPRLKKYLVAARTDRGTVGVSRERIEALVAELGFEKEWFETSAKEGRQIADLAATIRAGIPWGEMPSVVSTELFQRIKEFLIRTKEGGRVLVEEAQLFAEYTQQAGEATKLEQFKTCVDRLRDAGLIRRLAFGDLLLLQPEVLDNYASALINTARTQPDGLGWIREDDVLAGKFDIPTAERLSSKAQERQLLPEMVRDLIEHEIALREQTPQGTMLIFPSQYTRENPTLPDPPGKTLIFEFAGPVTSIYTTLAVRLAQSGTFSLHELWKNAVSYQFTKGQGESGLFLQEISEGQGRLTLFHSELTPPLARSLFEGFVEDHLRSHALPDSIQSRQVICCAECQTPVSDIVIERVRARGKQAIGCQVCGEEISLVPATVGSTSAPATAEKVRAMGRQADENRELAEAAAILDGKRKTNDFDVFLCHRSPDKPAVKKIGEALKQRGILPWLDEWEIRPGDQWITVLATQIDNIKSVAIFLSDEDFEKWVPLEVQGFLSKVANRTGRAIPVILPTAKKTPELPLLLRLFHAVDFRQTDPDPMDQLIWGITGERDRRDARPDRFK